MNPRGARGGYSVDERVTFFATCLGSQFHAEACADAIHLLEYLGSEVKRVSGLTCCGQPAHSSGHAHDAQRMARHTAHVLRDAGVVVLPSGSCASMVRSGYREIINGRQVADLARRTFELSEYLVNKLAHGCGEGQVGRSPRGPWTGLVGKHLAYHHGCHALREAGIRQQPVELLRRCGAEVVRWAAAEECCGFGGLFSTKFPEVSRAMADRKLDTLPAVDAVVSAEPGCLMQLEGRRKRRGLRVPFLHLATVLRAGIDPV